MEPLRQYTLEIPDPVTGKKLLWSGANRELPVIVEIFEHDVYVVIVPETCDVDLSRYGNPNPPYVVLRHVVETPKEWKQVPLTQFPQELRKINLPYDFPHVSTYAKTQPILTVTEVQDFNRNLDSPKMSDYVGLLQSPIPGDFDSWKYRYKKASGFGCAN